jgi:hypothetical protein
VPQPATKSTETKKRFSFHRERRTDRILFKMNICFSAPRNFAEIARRHGFSPASLAWRLCADVCVNEPDEFEIVVFKLVDRTTTCENYERDPFTPLRLLPDPVAPRLEERAETGCSSALAAADSTF